MKKFIIIFSLALSLLLLAGIGIGYKYLTDSRPDKDDEINAQYDIIVEDEIKVYVGQPNVISPYLISNDGSVEIARFDYSSSNTAISVAFDGTITINSIPKEDVYVTISERNTGVSKQVKLNIIQSLESVLGLIAPDGNLIQGSQSLIIGNTYAITVITEPNGMSIENYCTVVTKDSNGNEKKVFDISYDADKVLLTVVGLGKGQITISVENDGKEIIHYSNINFTSSMTDEVLGNKIIQQSNKELLSVDDLKAITSLIIDDSITDIKSLSALPSLNTIFLDSETVLPLQNKPNDYCYRVPEGLFFEYCGAEEWTDFKNILVPYTDEFSGKYIVYHSDKATEIAFEQLHSAYELNKYDATGYNNTHWVDKDGNTLTDEYVRNIAENGVHAYAVWQPIQYKVTYHIRDFEISDTDTWTYDMDQQFRDSSAFTQSISRTGYRFAGWTDNKNASIYSSNVKYVKGESYSNLTDVENKEVHLYDLWEPIEYTIIFDTDDETAVIPDLIVEYSKAYTLPSASKPGYTFSHWKTKDSTQLQPGINNTILSTQDRAEIVLEPVFNQIQYTIEFDLNGGFSPLDRTIVTGAKVTLNYSQQYTLPTLTKEGYTVYSWVCDENGKTYSSTDTLYKEFASACTVKLRAVWTAAIYTINYDCNGGMFEEQPSLTVNRFWDDGASLIEPIRTGYTFVGWRDDAAEFDYALNGSEWNRNLIHSTSENGKVFNLKAIWVPNTYTVTLGAEGGSVDPASIVVTFDGTYGALPNPSKTGYTFAGWYLGEDKINATSKVATASDHTLTAHWTANTYSVTFDSAGGSSCNGITVTYGSAYGSLPSPSRDNAYGDGGYTWYSFSGWYLNGAQVTADTIVTTADNHTLVASWNSGWTSTSSGGGGGSCLVKGSLIMLPNGTFTEIENLKVGDAIMTFDHLTGKYIESQIAFTFYANTEIKVISLDFSNGINLKLANGGHGLFDVTLNKYVLITPDNVADFVGHEFSYVSYVNEVAIRSKVKLQSYKITTELVERYDIATANQLNHIANGLLACSDTLVGFCNTFDFNNDQTFNAEKMQNDIEAYGLFEYKDWSSYVSYEEFMAFNGQYFKVAIAKGLMTEDDLFNLIQDLRTTWQ